MPIPDEARQAAWDALQRFIVGREGDRNGVDVMLDAVAPHIARAAQVQVLRKLADEMATSEIATSGDTVERETMWEAVCWARDMADQIERGER